MRIAIERSVNRAEHQVLFNVSDITKGNMFYLNEEDALIVRLKKLDKAKPRSHMQIITVELISFKWLFFALLALLTLE